MKSRWARFKSERFNVKTVQLFTFSRRQEVQHKYFAFSTLVCSKKTKSFVERKSAKIKRSVIFIFSFFCKKEISTNYSGLFRIVQIFIVYNIENKNKCSVRSTKSKPSSKIYKNQKVSRLFFLLRKREKYCQITVGQ